MIIDSHQHFWKYDPQKHSWINDKMSRLKQDFLPTHLQKEFNANGVSGCIAVQADQSEAETEFLLSLADQNSFIKGVVGWVDLRSEQVEERLSHFAKFPKLVGFRHVVQDEPDNNFVLREEFKRGVSLLSRYGLTYDILIYPTQMPAANKIVEAFPDQKFVIDHLAKPYIKKGTIEPWKTELKSLAAKDNVYCKVSGMVTEADWQNWQYDDFVPYLDATFEFFGADRIMFGSDWPVCLLAGEYSEVKSIIEKYIAALSEDEKSKIMGRTAQVFYGIS
ncbi:amidohydrolase family protein [Fulvivirgaceae bacterium BMA12]|uniref:Amidohydrolase family protein n=1 Tax=Agaribacillus aureus TaxID=3051825 RepID=A0ABT8L6H3_9BACT|nr:amidohydrolase family protein [Fulvivirgaceae bacterium BMA12]